MLKLIIAVALLVCASADVSHLPRPVFAPVPFVGAPRSGAPVIAILRQSQDIEPDGRYEYAYETENGISVEEQGRPVQISPQEQSENVQGSFQYTAPDGSPVQVSYVANENGFQPSGNVLPTPPPVPLAIQRALDFLETSPAQSRQ